MIPGASLWMAARMVVAVSVCASFAGGQQSVSGVTIRGVVRSADGQGIPGAQVLDQGSGLKTISDSAGAFLLPDVALGDRTLDVRRLGFAPQQFPITLVAGRNRNVALTLSPVAQALPDVNVADKLAKPARYANTHRYDQFYARRSQGFGKFLTREDIDRLFKTNTPELLQGVAGIRVRRVGNDWKVQSLRCQLGMPGLSDPSEFIRVYVDGTDVGDASQLTLVNPAEIEAMEIYQGPGELPAEARGKGCAAIFIWTRDGS
jgi:TonB-dependent starch-binding outer membrane protein SusC